MTPKPPRWLVRNVQAIAGPPVDVNGALAAAHDTDTEREGFLPARLSDTALRAALVPRPTGGADGQALVKSGTDVVWGTVAGGTGGSATSISRDVTSGAATVTF